MCCGKNCTRIIFKFHFNLLWVKHSLPSSLKGIWYCDSYCTKIHPSVLLTVLWTYFVIEAKIYFLQGHNLISKTHFHIIGNLHQDQGSKFQWLPYKNQTSRQPFHCGGRCGCAGRKGEFNWWKLLFLCPHTVYGWRTENYLRLLCCIISFSVARRYLGSCQMMDSPWDDSCKHLSWHLVR